MSTRPKMSLFQTVGCVSVLPIDNVKLLCRTFRVRWIDGKVRTVERSSKQRRYIGIAQTNARNSRQRRTLSKKKGQGKTNEDPPEKTQSISSILFSLWTFVSRCSFNNTKVKMYIHLRSRFNGPITPRRSSLSVQCSKTDKPASALRRKNCKRFVVKKKFFYTPKSRNVRKTRRRTLHEKLNTTMR